MPPHSAISKLQEDIDYLSSAIDAQTAILQDLINRRGDARKRLNFLLDPMARLPLEIQSHIFLEVCVDEPDNAPNSPPILFLSICRLWREIALSTPKLWAKIQIDSTPRGSSYLELCKLWLERARSLPLNLTLHGSLRLEESLCDLLAVYSPRLEDLTLCVSFRDSEDSPYMIWQREEASLSSLKTLSIAPTYEDPYYGNMHEWLDLFRDAPVLSHCTMANTFFMEQAGDELDPNPLTHTSLETMQLGEPHATDTTELSRVSQKSSSSVMILRQLTLPALKVLTLSEFDISDDEFIAFLSRSSPPLESLEMTLPHRDQWLHPLVSHCFRLIPTLTTLNLFVLPGYDGEIELFLPFVEVLSSPEVLPNLRAVTFHTACPVKIDYDNLSRMLSLRFRSGATPLERFELRFSEQQGRDYAEDLPGDEARATMRGLVGEGLKIYIGHTVNLP
ncbi:F-box domain-containing protein [Favolaschia claudopus]|uniref:F-box domain-containing protein n=1 Tax=Favolaschia claudopus TaxID=2862362 RepID=A0AAW0B9A2_9AGAR